jgi:hypothetical protein
VVVVVKAVVEEAVSFECHDLFLVVDDDDDFVAAKNKTHDA